MLRFPSPSAPQARTDLYRPPNIRRPCPHRACLLVHATNSPSARSRAFSAHSAGRSLAVLLVSTLRSRPAVLLTRLRVEDTYSFTAGARSLLPSDSACYAAAAHRMLVADANIRASAAQMARIDFYTVCRLRNGTPVLIGHVGRVDALEFEKCALRLDDTNSHLFRVCEGKERWRIVGGGGKTRLVSESVRKLFREPAVAAFWVTEKGKGPEGKGARKG